LAETITEEIVVDKLSVSRVYDFSMNLYKDDFFKFLIPMLAPTLLMIGVSAVFYTMAVPAFEIENLTQYYSFSTYAALKDVLGTWYYILLASVAVYLLMVHYGMSTITGILSEGLISGEDVSLDVGGRKGLWGFVNTIIPAVVIGAVGYLLATTYGRYYAIVAFLLGYIFMYMVSSSILDGAIVGKNMGLSIESVFKAPLFSFLSLVLPFAFTLFVASLALMAAVLVVPAFVLAVAALSVMILLPYMAIVITTGYMLINSDRYGL